MKIYKHKFNLIIPLLLFSFFSFVFYGCKNAEANEEIRDSLSLIDQQFLHKAGLYNTSEIALAKIAIVKAKDSSIIQFAERVLKDHKKSQIELIGLGALKQYNVPNIPDSSINVNLSYMEELETGFDNIYINQQYTVHQNTIELYDEISKKGHDKDIKHFANKNLPDLYNHLIKTDSIKKSLKNLL